MVVSVGDEEAEEGLRACLAKGADRALRIWDDSLAGADPLAVARVLAAAVERESPDLVLCGVQSSDAVHSATGVALGGPSRAAARGRGQGARLRRRLELGHRRARAGGRPGRACCECDLPALLTIQTGINEPRYANLRAIKQAKEKPLDVPRSADLGLDADALAAAAGSRVRSMAPPRCRRGRGDARTARRPRWRSGSPSIVKERMSG